MYYIFVEQSLWIFVLVFCNMFILPLEILLQGFYYDAFYGDLGLNEDHFKQIVTGASKAVAVLIQF